MNGQRATVLLAESHEGIRHMLHWYLFAAGYDVLVATDGQQTIEVATAACPDLILMDLTLPVVSGLDAIARIRVNDSCLQVPIIAMSFSHGVGDSSWKERVLASGCSAIIDHVDLIPSLDSALPRYLH